MSAPVKRTPLTFRASTVTVDGGAVTTTGETSLVGDRDCADVDVQRRGDRLPPASVGGAASRNGSDLDVRLRVTRLPFAVVGCAASRDGADVDGQGPCDNELFIGDCAGRNDGVAVWSVNNDGAASGCGGET